LTKCAERGEPQRGAADKDDCSDGRKRSFKGADGEKDPEPPRNHVKTGGGWALPKTGRNDRPLFLFHSTRNRRSKVAFAVLLKGKKKTIDAPREAIGGTKKVRRGGEGRRNVAYTCRLWLVLCLEQTLRTPSRRYFLKSKEKGCREGRESKKSRKQESRAIDTWESRKGPRISTKVVSRGGKRVKEVQRTTILCGKLTRGGTGTRVDRGWFTPWGP